MAKRMRDVTHALELAKIIRQYAGDIYSPDINNLLVKILEDLDARTGRKDPSKRRKPAKRAAKSAKKVGARTR